MKLIVTMRWLIAILFICLQLPLLAQTTPYIDGPSSVCPNTTVRFEFKPSGCSSVVFGDVQGPLPVTVVGRTNSYIDVIFPQVTTSAPFRILASYSCQNASPVVGNLVKEVTVKMTSASSSSLSIPCEFSGNYTFKYGMEPAEATNISWSNTAGWSQVGQIQPPYDGQAGIKMSDVTYNINNTSSGAVTISFGNSGCPNLPASSQTFNVTRPTSNSLAAPVFTTKPTQMCRNTTTTFTVQPYANAISYTWNSSQPGIKINNQTPPVTIPASSNGNSVTVTSGSTDVNTNITVTATSVCGQTLAASGSLTVGQIQLRVTGPTMVAAGDISDYVCSPVLTGATYEWQPGGAIIRNGDGSYKIRAEWPQGVGGVPTTVGVVVSNHPATCGGFIVAYLDVFVADPGVFLISPNPASTSITVSAQNRISAKSNAKTAVTPVQINEIMIVDKFNNIKKITKYPSGTTNISVDVSNLPADMYILRIRSNDTWISRQVMISGH